MKCFKVNKVYLYKTPKIILLKIYTETQENYCQPPVKQLFIKATNEVDLCHFNYLNS